MGRMEQQLWDMARERGGDALSCNMGGDCKYGTKGAMKIYRLSDDEIARVRKLVGDSVLSDWASECRKTYPQCVEKWNATIGKVLGVSVGK